MSGRAHPLLRALVPLVVALTTVLASWLTSRLRLSSDLTGLFPDQGEAAHLARFARVFGGVETAMVLVRGEAPEEVEAAAREVGQELRGKPSVSKVLDRAPAARPLHPTQAWLFAGPAARARLERALTPEGMRERLDETITIRTAPGTSDLDEWLATDPLRLATIPWEKRAELAAGVRGGIDEPFAADSGRARLVIVEARGNAFVGEAAAAFARDSEAAFATVRAKHPSVRLDTAGGHAVAHATEQMLRRDLMTSSVVSVVLASLLFVVTFRRVRALVAVLPPLALGTLWTTALAALSGQRLSAIAIAFTAVVVGVGVDTGVHVYAALLEGRRRGLSPHDAARFARRETWRPTMTAAVVAGLAFGALALSEVRALGQLGVLCGLGEVLTAIAILAVTPEIGAWIERGPPPPPLRPAWLRAVRFIASSRRRAAVALALATLPVIAIAALGWPAPADVLVAIKPRGLAPLETQEAVFSLFGGRAGQWVVLSVDRDRERAAARADAIAEALEPLAADGTISGFDALASFAPAEETQRRRLAERDRLDLPSKQAALAAALEAKGFDKDACAPALEAFATPSRALVSRGASADPAGSGGALAWLASRHMQDDAGETLVATYVRSNGDPSKDARTLAAIRAADPSAVVTGYPYLERTLRGALGRDLPRIGLVAVLLAAIALRAALRNFRGVLLALGGLALELCAVGLAMRALGLRWHVYDALVLPVLVGITLDESMFLLHAAKGGERLEDALDRQGPLVVSTALTTAAGFGALLVCRFDGLRDLGAVGALGAVLGLLAALVVVPAGLALWPGRGATPTDVPAAGSSATEDGRSP